MIYVFAIAILYVFFRQKEHIIKKKRNVLLFLLLSILGLSMGIIYHNHPYIPSIASELERVMR